MSTNCKVIRNSDKNGIEIKFDKKPSSDILEQIKDRRFRWSRYGKVWYKKFNQADYDFAQKLCGSSGTVTGYEPKKVDAPIEIKVYNLEDVNKKNFSYVGINVNTRNLPKNIKDAWSQATINDVSSSRIVVMSQYKGEAERIAKSYFQKYFPELADAVTFDIYPRNYIRESRKLFTDGFYLPQEDASNSFPIFSTFYKNFKGYLDGTKAKGELIYPAGTILYIKENKFGSVAGHEIEVTEDYHKGSQTYLYGINKTNDQESQSPFRVADLQKEYPKLLMPKGTSLHLVKSVGGHKKGQEVKLISDFRIGMKEMRVQYETNKSIVMTVIESLSAEPSYFSLTADGTPLDFYEMVEQTNAKPVLKENNHFTIHFYQSTSIEQDLADKIREATFLKHSTKGEIIVIAKNKTRAVEIAEEAFYQDFPKLKELYYTRVYEADGKISRNAEVMFSAGRYLPIEDTSKVWGNFKEAYNLIAGAIKEYQNELIGEVEDIPQNTRITAKVVDDSLNKEIEELNEFVETLKKEKSIKPKVSAAQVYAESVAVLQASSQKMAVTDFSAESKLSEEVFSGEYFKTYPDKILGKVLTHNPKTGRQLTDAFNKPRKEVWGTMKDVEKGINAPTAQRYDHFQEGRIVTITAQVEEDTRAANARKIRESLKKTRKTNKLKVAVRGKCGKDLQCLADTIIKYNTDIEYTDTNGVKQNYSISQEEMTVWVTYQVNRGIYELETIKTNEWKNFYSKSPNYTDWYEKGLVAYTGKDFVPVSVYYSGNIYRKIGFLKSNKDAVVDKIGIEGYERQLSELEAAKPKRLRMESDIDNRLLLSPFNRIWKRDEVKFDETIQNHEYPGYGFYLYKLFEAWMKSEVKKHDFEFEGAKSNAAEITKYWLNKKNADRGANKIRMAIIKRNAAVVGRHLFDRFCVDAIPRDKRNLITNLWNAENNNYKDIDFHRIPVGFDISKKFKGGDLEIRPAQREGVAFMNNRGRGILAYDVGVGKTMTSILAIADGFKKGMFKRPLVVVPNKVYHKWIGEIRGVIAKKDLYKNGKKVHKKGELIAEGILPNVEVNDYYNLGTKHVGRAVDDLGFALTVNEYSITVITYEGLNAIGFDPESDEALTERLKTMLAQADGGRGEAADAQKADAMLDKALDKSYLPIEDFGFDSLFVDEAHNFRNLFKSIPGDIGKDGKRERSNFESQSGGEPTGRAVKLLVLNTYIHVNNRNRNTFGLTATPFNNRATEIFSMLALFDYKGMEDFGIFNIQQFCESFINQSNEDVWTASGEYKTKPVIRGYDNIQSLQSMVFRAINYKTGEDANIVRPNKVVLPLYKDDRGLELPLEFQADTKLPPSNLQKTWIKEVQDFVNYKRTPGVTKGEWFDPLEEERGALKSKLFQHYELHPKIKRILEDEKGKEYKQNIVVGDYLIALNAMRVLTFSPYALAFDGVKMYDSKKITPKQFINDSPKLKYICECIKSVRDYHIKQGTPVSGQIIYSDTGTAWFEHIRTYLIEEVGYAPHEVETFYGKSKGGGKTAKQREEIKDKFQRNEVKVIIGSSTLREGVDLQNHCSVMYSAFLDWNPTDVHQFWGRGWRFGNKHSHIRIVIPLLENSSDIFTWQKLSEKISRVNSVWTRGKKSQVFEEKELDAEQLKKSLITDIGALVAFEVEEQAKKVGRNLILTLDNIKDLKEARNLQTEFAKKDGQLRLELSRAKDIMPDVVIDETDIKAVYRLVKRYVVKLDSVVRSMTVKSLIDAHIKYARKLERIQKNVLAKYKLDLLDDYGVVIEMLEKESEVYRQKLQTIKSEKNILKIRTRIELEKEKERANSRPVSERVNSFMRTNYLLDCFKDTHTCDIYGRAQEAKSGKIVTKVRQKKVSLKIDDTPAKPKKLIVPKGLAKFLPPQQLATIREFIRNPIDGEAYYDDVVSRLDREVKSIPKPYTTEKYTADEKIVYGKFYINGLEWYVLEYNRGEGMLYTWAIQNGDSWNAELGYTSLEQLHQLKNKLGLGSEMSFHWTPKYLSEVKHQVDSEHFKKPKFTLAERIESGEEKRDLSAFGFAAPSEKKESPNPVSTVSKKERAQNTIDLLKRGLRYVSGNKASRAKKTIELLEKGLKYIR